MTVADLIETYTAKHVRTLRSKKDRERHLQVDVLPVIGGVKLAELHRRDVHRVLDVINERGSPQSARAAFNVMRAMCRWAVFVATSITVRWREWIAPNPQRQAPVFSMTMKSKPCGKSGGLS